MEVFTMATKTISLKEVEQKFSALYPVGSLLINNSNALVNFNGKKEYKYSFNTPHELAQKLNVLTYSDKMSRKGFKQLSCTCWTDEKENYKTCSNCGKVVNVNGIERVSLFSFIM